MRPAVASILIFTAFSLSGANDTQSPPWLQDPHSFCQELSKRTNGAAAPVPFGKPSKSVFEDYPVAPIATPRANQGVLGKYDWMDGEAFSQSVKDEIKDGPDFAGRFAILVWSCGSACQNATIADVQTARTHETPFVGIVGCQAFGDVDTLQRKADSSLLVAQGSLEMAYGHLFDEGPCGTFWFLWRAHQLHLIGCEIPARSPSRSMPK